jgi:broad-specificity NMP kinase
MKLAISGTPGTGKTTFAKALGKELNLEVINEKDFALKCGIGSFNDQNELEIPTEVFEQKANEFLEENENIIFEGHTLCESKLNVDKFVIITIDPEKLQLRLELRDYNPEKIMDNLFCEGIEYCKKHAQRNYKKNLIIIESADPNQMIGEILPQLEF